MAYAAVTSLMTTLGLLLMQANYTQKPLQIKSLREKVCSLQALLETLDDMNDVESVKHCETKIIVAARDAEDRIESIAGEVYWKKQRVEERCLKKGSRESLLQASSKSIHSAIKELKKHMNKDLQQAFKSIDLKRKELMRRMKKGVQATRSSNLPEYSPPQLDNNVVGRKIELDDMMRKLTQTSSNEPQEVRCGNAASYAAQGNPPYQMTPLRSSESWELFQDKILVKEQLSPEFIEIWKNIANSCQGLPLTIVVVAGLLSKCKSALDRWKQVEQNVKSTLFEDSHHQCKKILASSYQNLPRHLKTCFLYFGVFPEDTEVHVKRLIKPWIAEGFLKEAADTSLETVAEGCLHELIDKKMVFISRHNFCREVKRCKIHDLLHDISFPSKLCTNEIFASMPNLKKMGIQYDEEHRIKSPSSDLSCLLVAQGLEAVKIEFDDKNIFPPTLKKLTLVRPHFPWEATDIVGTLPYLEALKLKNYACAGDEWKPAAGGFSLLKFLSLDCIRFTKWIATDENFPVLERLCIY
ncbi:hypothetical protein R3W88_028382 [Solanum pinnatisectum]|uniref:Disease resistance protein winged helix domain-containing protein n=1 Tax=Solanum pinnatisectum TaxID=50273 RepID=A0AAV9LJC8_9SOLN|nr:hypothetical protein R3W88_028382 [Solanum pinnatisectum]